MRYLAENSSRLADEIPFCDEIKSLQVDDEHISGLINVFNRPTDLDTIVLPIQL